MKAVSHLALVFTLVLTAAACNGGGSGGDPAGDDDDDDDGATATPTPTPAGTPTFQADIVPIFETSCGTANNSCHSRVAYAANSSTVGGACRGWLSLENASIGSQFYDGPQTGQSTGCPDRPLYERLTADGLSNSWQCGPNVFNPSSPDPNVPYILEGDPEASYLYRKLTGGPYCDNSLPMPNVGTISADTIDVVRRWIEAGAPE